MLRDGYKNAIPIREGRSTLLSQPQAEAWQNPDGRTWDRGWPTLSPLSSTAPGNMAGIPGVRSGRYQKWNFSTSSTVRAVLTVDVICPNVFGALMSRAGGPKLGVLVRLNASARNSK